MTGRWDIDNPRTEAVRDASTVNGIDYLEVLDGQTRLEVHFLHPLPGQTGGVPTGGTTLNRTHLVVVGGDRVRGLRVVGTSTSGDVLTVTVSEPGDFSTYQLRLADPVTDLPPVGFDPRRSSVDFTFKAGCPVRFDCCPDVAAPVVRTTAQVRDYLAKDYDSFRQLMLDRMTTTMPGWTERNPADVEIALVELLAFAADRLSYEQDAIATEAYLGTARRRVSVRRHARLLGYQMHEGCAARTFVHVQAPQALTIPAGQQFRTGPATDPQTLTFESLHSLAARPQHNTLHLYTWTDDETVLPAGATHATLVAATGIALIPGDLLLLEETVGAATGDLADADLTHRRVVRLTAVTPATDPLDGSAVIEIDWDPGDALPFPLTVRATTVTDTGPHARTEIAVARGNIVLVEHGAMIAAPVQLSKAVDVAKRSRPPLSEGRPTYAVEYEPTAAASELVELDPRRALPAVTVRDDAGRTYLPVPDLLETPPTEPAFVVEPEDDGRTTLRFGDDVYGRRPDPGDRHLATYRVGHGAVANVGPEAITVLAGSPAVVVRNPVPATGGVDPEPTEQVRTDAPHAFRVLRRAVTAADYGTVLTERLPGVQRAAGRLRWTGSWHTAFVTVDRVGGAEVDEPYRQQVATFLEDYRMAGVDVDVSSPVPVPVELTLAVCASPDRFNQDVESDILAVLSSGVLADGRRGLFHPDNFTFGVPVYLSRVYAAVLGVPGVRTVTATAFHRYGQPDRDELANGVLRVHDLEIAQLANDPDVPERGLLTVSVEGGR